MTMFNFMANAFYLLGGIVCIALSITVIYSVAVGLLKTDKRNDNDGRY